MLDTDHENTLSFVNLVSYQPRFGYHTRVPATPLSSQTRTSFISNKAMLDTDRENTLSFVILVLQAICRGIAPRASHIITVPNTD
jgi:hypothetical protein